MLKFKFPKIEEKHNFSEGEKCHLPTFEDCSLGTEHTRIMKIVSKCMLETHLKSQPITLKHTY